MFDGWDNANDSNKLAKTHMLLCIALLCVCVVFFHTFGTYLGANSIISHTDLTTGRDNLILSGYEILGLKHRNENHTKGMWLRKNDEQVENVSSTETSRLMTALNNEKSPDSFSRPDGVGDTPVRNSNRLLSTCELISP